MENLSNLDKLRKLILSTCSEQIDALWIKRNRKISTMTLIHLLCHLVSKNNGVMSTLLGQAEDSPSITPAAFTKARKRFKWQFIRTLFYLVFSFFRQLTAHQFLWYGRRIFAVDGSSVTCPLSVNKLKYPKQGKSYYPSGKVSVLYQLIAEVPCDMVISRHTNERANALRHLHKLTPGDILVYDRGYFSAKFLEEHLSKEIDAVFRLSKTAFKEATKFFKSKERDTIVYIGPSKKNCGL